MIEVVADWENTIIQAEKRKYDNSGNIERETVNLYETNRCVSTE